MSGAPQRNKQPSVAPFAIPQAGWPTRRVGLGALAAAALFAAAAYPSLHVSLLATREAYRLGEVTGIMDRSKGLGGQVMGYNFLRSPDWMHPVAHAAGAAIGFGPALTAALLLFERIGFGPLHVTLCGVCGRRLKGLREPACPACGATL